jgi:hypothetical protein
MMIRMYEARTNKRQLLILVLSVRLSAVFPALWNTLTHK